ncbi:MAG: CBS domain-containing protein [Chloroflexota bacterium]
MVTVRQLMKSKSNQKTYSVLPADTVYKALQVMAEHNIGAVLVREKDQILGIFTERDYLRKVILKGRSSNDTQIQEIMTTEMIMVNPDTTLEDCMELMHNHYIRHLPVLESEQVTGMVSMRDVIEAILTHKQKRIEFLEDYIMGREYRK